LRKTIWFALSPDSQDTESISNKLILGRRFSCRWQQFYILLKNNTRSSRQREIKRRNNKSAAFFCAMIEPPTFLYKYKLRFLQPAKYTRAFFYSYLCRALKFIYAFSLLRRQKHKFIACITLSQMGMNEKVYKYMQICDFIFYFLKNEA